MCVCVCVCVCVSMDLITWYYHDVICIGLHEMERRFVCETASLDRAGAGGAMPRSSRYATKRTYPTLRFFSKKRLRFVSSLRCDRRRYSGINTRFSVGSTLRAFSVIAVLRGDGSRSRNSLGSFAGKFYVLIFCILSYSTVTLIYPSYTYICIACKRDLTIFRNSNNLKIEK